MAGRRIVLLEMSADDVEDFVTTVHEHGEVFSWGNGDAGIKASIEAVVARPMAWCKCNIQPESRGSRRRRLAAKRESGWHRGGTFGWWVCAQCNKPSRAVVMHFLTSMLGGANDLLPKLLGIGEPIDPSSRWALEGGVPNEHANANTAHIRRNSGYEAGTGRRAQKRAAKPRRSDEDRAAAILRRNADLARRQAELHREAREGAA